MTPNEVLFDTNAMISWMDDREGIATAFPHQVIPVLPFAVVAELHFGVMNSTRIDSNLAALAANLHELTVLYPDARTNARYGEVAAALQRRGRRIQHNALWIAALAIQHRMPLLTRDRHFDNVDGLVLISW